MGKLRTQAGMHRGSRCGARSGGQACAAGGTRCPAHPSTASHSHTPAASQPMRACLRQVHGTLIELFDCRKELYTATEVVANNSLFHVVVRVQLLPGCGRRTARGPPCLALLTPPSPAPYTLCPAPLPARTRLRATTWRCASPPSSTAASAAASPSCPSTASSPLRSPIPTRCATPAAHARI